MYSAYKKSPRFYASHFQDVYTDLGFDYRGRVFDKTISKTIMQNIRNKGILSMIEPMIIYLIDAVKQIRLQYMISLNKTDRNLN